NDTNKLYTNSKKLFKNTVNYLIYGKVNYSNPLTTNDSGLKTTTWEISYNVMDMETGKNVLFGSFSATAEATDQWKLYDTIRREKIAPVITDAIYYGL
ncbi:MAG TPA: hypothetical protein VFC68_02025, partial [Treponemataceae bacterium]|nr:hypothetical protein [Treponemataceae bacterium]